MASITAQAGVKYSSTTFEFRSAYPDVRNPALQVSDPNLVDPTHADCLLDGEWVRLDENGKVARIVAGDLATGARAFHQVHGKPGRTDIQMAKAIPVLKKPEYEYVTTLFDTAETWTPGMEGKVGLLAAPKANTAGIVAAAAGDRYNVVFEKYDSDGWAYFRRESGTRPA